MKHILWVCILSCCCVNAFADTFDSKTGTFVDESRRRTIPYKVYYPEPLQGRYPVIIVSHGLGGSRDNNEYFSEYLASRGFVVLNVQHQGSDESVIRGMRDRRQVQMALARSLMQPANAVNRFIDMPFVVSQLTVLNESDKQLKGHLNLDALGMAGHSYGAISTMVAAGERVGARLQSVKVPRLRAGILMSPSPPRAGADVARVYADVSIPLFHMTGTDDVSLVDVRNVSPEERTEPFRVLNIPNQYLLVLNKADHMTFSGRRSSARDKKYIEAIQTGALAFFQAYLLDDKKAETWLRDDYKKTLDAKDVFEFK